jgi:hypothetical protein
MSGLTAVDHASAAAQDPAAVAQGFSGSAALTPCKYTTTQQYLKGWTTADQARGAAAATPAPSSSAARMPCKDTTTKQHSMYQE